MSTPPRRIGRARASDTRPARATAAVLVHVLADDDELVAAEAGDQVARAARWRAAASATSTSSSSPAVWPSESLTTLKLSRSRKRQARPPAPGGTARPRTAASSVRLGSPVSGSWLAWWASLASKASRSVMSSMVPTKPAPTPGVNRWAKRMTVVRTVPSSRTRRAWVSTSSPSRAAATRSMTPSRSSSWIAVDPAGAEQLLGAAGRPGVQNASLTCASRMPCSESRVGTGERSVSAEKRRSWASAVARSARSCSLAVERMRIVHMRPPGDGVVTTTASTVGAAGGADRQGHAGGALAAQQQLELPATEGREELGHGQRAQVVQAVAEQLHGALVAPGQPLRPPDASRRRGWRGCRSRSRCRRPWRRSPAAPCPRGVH